MYVRQLVALGIHDHGPHDQGPELRRIREERMARVLRMFANVGLNFFVDSYLQKGNRTFFTREQVIGMLAMSGRVPLRFKAQRGMFADVTRQGGVEIFE